MCNCQKVLLVVALCLSKSFVCLYVYVYIYMCVLNVINQFYINAFIYLIRTA